MPRQCVVVIPTLPSRADYLSSALESVQRQHWAPEKIVVVIDGDRDYIPIVEAMATRIGLSIDVLTNTRGKGASGARNTGIYHVASELKDALIAFLDDDDWWEPNHLALVCETGADVVTTGECFRGPPPFGGVSRLAPSSLVAEDFLMRNAGITGSNLAVCTALLVRIGAFDETLPTNNDIDIVVRLADCGASYAAIPVHTTNVRLHDVQLSSPDTSWGNRGSERFIEKYKHRMSSLEQLMFCLVRRLEIGWQPTQTLVKRGNIDQKVSAYIALPPALSNIEARRVIDLLTEQLSHPLIGVIKIWSARADWVDYAISAGLGGEQTMAVNYHDAIRDVRDKAFRHGAHFVWTIGDTL
ncbi:glycosyltransferase family 2 protein [Burkholderia sp. NLJ2]|uniref:glycosyltransferase family 2 protein n=1 Tax=Burkholderia sp. NLJ2 TaxID=3090699 RepID=UPI003C6C1626